MYMKIPMAQLQVVLQSTLPQRMLLVFSSSSSSKEIPQLSYSNMNSNKHSFYTCSIPSLFFPNDGQYFYDPNITDLDDRLLNQMPPLAQQAFVRFKHFKYSNAPSTTLS